MTKLFVHLVQADTLRQKQDNQDEAGLLRPPHVHACPALLRLYYPLNVLC